MSMINKQLRDDILNNDFIYQVRNELRFDEAEYCRLVSSLVQLAEALKESSTIDKDLALCLYETPQAVRDATVGLRDAELSERLIEAWIELDQLAVDCLKEPPREGASSSLT